MLLTLPFRIILEVVLLVETAASHIEEQPSYSQFPACTVMRLSEVCYLKEKSRLKISYKLANLFLTLKDQKARVMARGSRYKLET